MATVIHGATLNASVNPNGLDTQVKFLYGTDPLLGDAVEIDLPVIPAGHDAVSVQAPITDLVADTTYFFKVSAANDEGTTDGDVLDFATPVDVITGVPVVQTLPATDVI
jgi:hypothetical protein